MQERFARVDDALIDGLFQPLAEWMDRHLALGPSRAARAGIDLASLAWILSEAGAGRWQDTRSAVVNGAVLVAGLWALTTLRGVFQRKSGGKANPLRACMQMHRAACLIWMMALALKAMLAASGIGLLAVGAFATAAVYLGACTNPPPRRVRMASLVAFGHA